MNKKKKFPDNPFPKRGRVNPKELAFDNLAKPIDSLAHELATLAQKYQLSSVELELTGDTTGKLTIKNSANSGLKVKLSGDLSGGHQMLGTPYVAHYSGEFFWRLKPNGKDFVKDGDVVRAGQLVAWAMGESKDMSFGIRADQDGIITRVAQNASRVEAGQTLLYYIEGDK